MKQRVAILGSTGSIGRNTLEIMERRPDAFQVICLSARGSNLDLLRRQIRKFQPAAVAVWDAACAGLLQSEFGPKIKIESGPEGLKSLATHPEVDTVINALVGAVGLAPTIAALESGKKVALANKETLVIGGIIIRSIIRGGLGRLLPIDSEHSALHQCLNGSLPEQVEKLILTASGGPFLNRDRSAFGTVTPQQALAHPNWDMGPKITIDSATLMNKGLEVIEAHFLFEIPYDRIEVVIHPQSIIHSMVAYRDGSILAQLGPADMKIPIQYALSYPDKWLLGSQRLNLAQIGKLTFREPDTDKFPCLRLAFEAGRQGGSLPVVMNAANEMAVAAFLAGRIRFTEIAEIVEKAMNEHTPQSAPDLDGILAIDNSVRQQLGRGGLV